MHYILLTELEESMGTTSCSIKGLPPTEITTLEKALTDLQIPSVKCEEFFEADTQGVQLLNMLSSAQYKVLGQSMAIEKSNMGGMTNHKHKIVWTLGKE